MKTSLLRATICALLLTVGANLRAQDTRRFNPAQFDEPRYEIDCGLPSALRIPACGELPGGKRVAK